MFKTRYDYLKYNKMELNCKDLNDKELAQLCIKYDIILSQDFKYLTRKQVIQKIETWTSQKVSKYKSRPRSNSNPNIKSITIPQTQNQTQVQRQRRMSTQGAPQKHEINYQVLYNLAYEQWTIKEILSGEAWSYLSIKENELKN